MKSKGKKERYTHWNAEFQKIARRNKKAFLSDHYKEIEENNRMGKTRDLFKNIRDTKGTFHAKMGSIKDRNGMDLTEAEDIKKRWQEYTELFKKDLHDPDNHDDVITNLEPDILECEVKWALESITMNKASGGQRQVMTSPSHCPSPAEAGAAVNTAGAGLKTSHALTHFNLTATRWVLVNLILATRKPRHRKVMEFTQGHTKC